MAKVVLIDSGPLVAALRSRDFHHRWASGVLSGMKTPCLTCEAVISESFFLLDGDELCKERLIGLLDREVVKVAFDFEDSRSDVLRLMERYTDTPMSFADACLVRMSETFRDCTVLTIDSDFLHYRRFGRQVIPLLKPD